MNMLRAKRFRLPLGLMIAIAAIGIITASVAVAGGYGGFDQASSAGQLSKARGLIHDWADTDGGEYVIAGEWTLDCHKACTKAKLNKIDFDMGVIFVRPGGGVKPGGGFYSAGDSSHSHQFSEFSATSVVNDGDNLLITGMITGTNEIGTVGITLRLKAVADGNATFYFLLDSVINTEVGGMIVESNAKKK